MTDAPTPSPIPAEDLDAALRLAVDAALRHVVRSLTLESRTSPQLHALAYAMEDRAEADDPLAALAGVLSPLLHVAANYVPAELPPPSPGVPPDRVMRSIDRMMGHLFHAVLGGLEGCGEVIAQEATEWPDVLATFDLYRNRLLMADRHSEFVISTAVRDLLIARIGGPGSDPALEWTPPPPPDDEEEG